MARVNYQDLTEFGTQLRIAKLAIGISNKMFCNELMVAGSFISNIELVSDVTLRSIENYFERKGYSFKKKGIDLSLLASRSNAIYAESGAKRKEQERIVRLRVKHELLTKINKLTHSQLTQLEELIDMLLEEGSKDE